MESNEGTTEGNGTGGTTGNEETPGWVAQLSSDLRDNEEFTGFKTLTDFGKAHLELKGKASELDGKIKNAIFKPGENATEDEIGIYRKAMGIPSKADEYEFPDPDGEKDEAMINWARGVFHEAGLSQDQATVVATAWNGFMKGLQDSHDEQLEKSKEMAMGKLKENWGNDFDKNLEFTRRGFQKFTNADFNEFCEETGLGNHPVLIEFIYKVGQAMGEDFVPKGQPSKGEGGDKPPGMNYETMGEFEGRQ